MKKLAFWGLLLFTVISNAETKTYKMRWILAHEPARVFERSARHFADIVSKASNNRLLVEIISATDLPQKTPLSPFEAFNLVKTGEYEMCQTYTTYLGRQDKQLWVLDLPFLFRDHKHAAKVLDGPIGQHLLAGLDKTGVKGLAFTYSGGYRIIPTEKKPIQSVADFKGMKIRVADSPVASAYLTELGAIPVQQVGDENFWQKGMDGFETTYARLENIKDDKSKYINETEHSLFLTSILINKSFFDKLPADLQKIVSESIMTTAQIERKDSIQDGLDLREAYAKKGLKITSLSADEKKKLEQAAKKIQTKYENYFEKNLVADIYKQ